jgi:glyoxylase-like metal-dependent hydrolase (beta-lactamase superfamily II)
MRQSLLALLALALAGFASAQDQDLSKVEIKVTKVAGTVSLLQGAGGNIAVSAGDDGIVMVDTEFAPLNSKIKAALAGLSPKPLRFIVDTHWHFDHTDGNLLFQADAPILAHDNLRKRLGSGGSIIGRKVDPAPKGALPILTYSDTVTIHLNGEDIVVLHNPHAHTDGDSIVYFTQSNVLHLGDEFVTYGFPFVDLDDGGSVVGMTAALKEVASRFPKDVKVIPGHGPVSTLDDVRNLVKMMEETTAIVRGEKAKGKTLAQVQQAKALDAYDKKWSGDFIKADKWIELVYNDPGATK